MPTKLTEQQRAYMFEHWPKVCEIPWNKVYTKGNFAVALNNMKRDARAAHPAGGAARAGAGATKGATKTIAKSIPAAGNLFPTKKGLQKYPINPCENAAFRKRAEDPLKLAQKKMEEMRNSGDPHKEDMLEMMGFMVDSFSAKWGPPAPANPAPANPAPAEEPDDGDESDPDDFAEDREQCGVCTREVSYCTCHAQSGDELESEDEDDEKNEPSGYEKYCLRWHPDPLVRAELATAAAPGRG